MLQCQFYLALSDTLFKLKMNATFKLLNHHQVTTGSNLEGFKSWFKMWEYIQITRGNYGATVVCVCIHVFVCVYCTSVCT